MRDEIEIYEEYDVPTVVGSDGETASTVSVAVSGDRDAAEIVRALRREEPDYVVERLLANV